MKNILIISQFFAPQNSIAAIRFTKVVKYLARTGNYHFYVICLAMEESAIKDEILLNDIQGVEEYITILPVQIRKIKKKESGQVNDDVRNKAKVTSKKTVYKKIKNELMASHQNVVWNIVGKLAGQILLFPYEIHDIIKELEFSNKAQKLVQNIGNKKISVIISTYGHIGTHLAGLKCMSIFKCGWIADYRDPVRGTTWLGKTFVRVISKRTDEKASYITGAAESYCGSGNYMQKFHTIYNSYDEEDIEGIEGTKNNSRLTICYAGRIYKDKQRMAPLFKVVNELEGERRIDKKRIEILYIGGQFAELRQEAIAYGVEDIITDGGLVPRKKALQVQMNSDILCVMTWNQKDDGDIMPGKFFEYLMMNKPILVLVAGDRGESKIGNIVNDSEVGYCYEEAKAESDYKHLKQWVYDKYTEYSIKGQLANNADKKYMEQYSSKVMAERFGELILKCF